MLIHRAIDNLFQNSKKSKSLAQPAGFTENQTLIVRPWQLNFANYQNLMHSSYHAIETHFKSQDHHRG